MSGRHDTHELTDLVVTCVNDGCPRGRLLGLVEEARPAWKPKLDKWSRKRSAVVDRVYAAAAAFENEWPLYMENALPSVLLMIEKHRDRDCRHDPHLFDAFVTSDFIESCFGCLKDSHLKLGKIDITNVTAIAASKKNHTFDTPENLVRTEDARRLALGEERMDLEEKVEFLKAAPWAAFAALSEEEQEWLYLTESKTATWKARRGVQNQLKADFAEAALGRKAAEKVAQEKREAGKVLKYNESLKFPLCHTKEDLASLLRDVHASNGAAKYSTAMQVEIVRTQLNIRKHVYGVPLEQGALLSKMRDGCDVKL